MISGGIIDPTPIPSMRGASHGKLYWFLKPMVSRCNIIDIGGQKHRYRDVKTQVVKKEFS